MWHLLTEEDRGSSVPESQQAADTAAVHAQCAVLVVDDDITIREAVVALLEDDGYVVEQAANGLEALAAVERRLPKLVLLDMRMPLMDGWAFVDELRKRNLDITLVAMTATYDARLWAQEIGASSYIGKPFQPDVLLELVDRLCRG
jgi:CheY-like chemotaxis protein